MQWGGDLISIAYYLYSFKVCNSQERLPYTLDSIEIHVRDLTAKWQGFRKNIKLLKKNVRKL